MNITKRKQRKYGENPKLFEITDLEISKIYNSLFAVMAH
jgi:hypothetical protein